MTATGIIGLGVVGGSLARAFDEAGIDTLGYDPYLGVGDAKNLGACSVLFICVPTPPAPDGSLDMTHVWTAIREVELHTNARSVVAVRSTVPPGSCDSLAESFPGLDFVSAPEFLVAARAMETVTRPDRILIGGRSVSAMSAVADLLSAVAPEAPVLYLEPSEAELVKLCSNAMLAAKVALANELADMCDRFGVAWSRVQAGVGMDRRIGPDHLTVTSERGFGGNCLPKDLAGLIAASEASDYSPYVLRAIADFNRMIREDLPEQRDHVLEGSAIVGTGHKERP